MNSEKLRSVGRHRYDGQVIIRTKNCNGCTFHLNILGEKRCYWGVAWKKIYDPRDGSKACAKIKEPSPREALLRDIEERDARISILGERFRQTDFFLT